MYIKCNHFFIKCFSLKIIILFNDFMAKVMKIIPSLQVLPDVVME